MILHQLKTKDLNRRVTVSLYVNHNNDYHIILYTKRLVSKKDRDIVESITHLTLETFTLLFQSMGDLTNRCELVNTMLNEIEQNRTHKLIKTEYIKR